MTLAIALMHFVTGRDMSAGFYLALTGVGTAVSLVMDLVRSHLIGSRFDKKLW